MSKASEWVMTANKPPTFMLEGINYFGNGTLGTLDVRAEVTHSGHMGLEIVGHPQADKALVEPARACAWARWILDTFEPEQ